MEKTPEQFLRDHLGEAALTYLLDLRPEQVPRIRGDFTIALSASQAAALGLLLLADEALGTSSEPEELAGHKWKLQLGTARGTADHPFGTAVRLLAGGELPTVPDDLPEIERLLARLAIDAFPALLVREPDWRKGFCSGISFHGHPLSRQFQAAVLGDETLGEQFVEDNPHTGPGFSTFRSSGHGGSQQLWSLAETLISAGWGLAQARAASPGVTDLVAAALDSLRTVQMAALGVGGNVTARVGLTGVLLPAGIDEVNLGWGRLRKADVRDELLIRATSLEGQLATTTLEGESLTINYSGDLVLEFEVPYIVRFWNLGDDDSWPAELNVGQQIMCDHIENVRLGLLLAFPEQKRVVVPSWTAVFDPLLHGAGVAWFDVPRTIGLEPFELTNAQVQDWEMWTNLVRERRIPTIGVAIRRMLAATTERSSPEDVLVDAAIVWENLFGAKAKTTQRVTGSLACLLGASPQDRQGRQSRYKEIYAKRCDVVHGDASVSSEVIQKFVDEAVGISLAALRAVFRTHMYLLDIPTSEARGREIRQQN